MIAFDGTGNRFSGTDSDSNILKIFRMLDRNDESQHAYYQPGIGTYVTSSSLSHTSRIARVKSWYLKAKDSAVGTSFAQHVMGGYKASLSFIHSELLTPLVEDHLLLHLPACQTGVPITLFSLFLYEHMDIPDHAYHTVSYEIPQTGR